MERNDEDSDDGITEYTRNNSYLFDVSYQPVRYVKFLVEAELPMHVGWIRPAAHVPQIDQEYQRKKVPDYGKPLSGYIYGQEFGSEFERNNDSYPSSYKAWRIGLGVEFEVPIPTVGLSYLATDCSSIRTERSISTRWNMNPIAHGTWSSR